MADEAIGTVAGQSIIGAGSEFIRDGHKIVRTLSVGGDTAKVAMPMTGAGETSPAVDIHADGDETFEGLLLRPVVRPSDTWTINTALADSQDVVLLRPTGGLVKIAVLITGMTGAKAYKEGDPVYLMDFTSTAMASANPSVGGLMAVPTGVNIIDTATHPPVLVGHLAHDMSSGGDATSAAAGRVAWIRY